MAETKKTTAYQRLQKAQSAFCKTGSPVARQRLNKAKDAYKKSAEKKGKSVTEINKTIARVTGKCKAAKKSK